MEHQGIVVLRAQVDLQERRQRLVHRVQQALRGPLEVPVPLDRLGRVRLRQDLPVPVELREPQIPQPGVLERVEHQVAVDRQAHMALLGRMDPMAPVGLLDQQEPMAQAGRVEPMVLLAVVGRMGLRGRVDQRVVMEHQGRPDRLVVMVVQAQAPPPEHQAPVELPVVLGHTERPVLQGLMGQAVLLALQEQVKAPEELHGLLLLEHLGQELLIVDISGELEEQMELSFFHPNPQLGTTFRSLMERVISGRLVWSLQGAHLI